MLAGAIVDLNDGSKFLSVEAERRLGERWKLELEARVLTDVAPHNTLGAFRNDSHVTLRLGRYF